MNKHLPQKEALLDLLEQTAHALAMLVSSTPEAPHAMLKDCMAIILPDCISNAWPAGSTPALVSKALDCFAPWLDDMEAFGRGEGDGEDGIFEHWLLQGLLRDLLHEAWKALLPSITPAARNTVLENMLSLCHYNPAEQQWAA